MSAFIDAHRDVYGVEPITRVLPIASSTYHEHALRGRNPERAPTRRKRDAELCREILRVFEPPREFWRLFGLDVYAAIGMRLRAA